MCAGNSCQVPGMARRSRPKTSKPSRIRGLVLRLTAVALMLAISYGGYLAWQATSEFEGRRWDIPAQVYAAPLELYTGRALSADDLVAELKRLGYREDPRLIGPGTYRVGVGRLEVATRGFSVAGDVEPEQLVAITFIGGRIAALRDSSGGRAAIVRLNPLLIGSLFPSHGEDRLIVAPDEIPPLLTDTLKAVEDRRFDSHFGVDPIAVMRAMFVNVTSGEIREGASTLTQQLVRSYFLTNTRSGFAAWWRKIREACMAVALELRYGKSDILHAYVNEVYLGQDGARAIHGFGLASQFYFGKPLAELELHELALMVAIVRGPSYYDPRRHPERALERRNLVLKLLAAQGVISVDDARTAAARPLDITEPGRQGAGYYPAFLDLVRRQLRADYKEEDLTEAGLVVFSTLDPLLQNRAERALTAE